MQRTKPVNGRGLEWAAAACLLATACRSAPPRVSSASELYTGDPPPSFVLRKFAPLAGPMERPSPVEREPGEFPSVDAGPFLLKELAVKSLAVSNQDIQAALETLAAIGYETIVTTGGAALREQIERRFTPDQLPVVMLNLNQDDEGFSFDPGRMGAGETSRMGPSHSGDVDRLIAFYHPDRAQALAALEATLRDVIDVPAAQVYIEGWVLEISEEDSKELGIRYRDSIRDEGEFILGASSVDGSGDVFSYFVDETGRFMPAVGMQWSIRALVENEKAEILSRPSLLALSNRQALIQILDVVQSPRQDVIHTQVSSSVNLQWEESKIGITLNLRPRVSADRQWVSLEIDAIVEAEDEENTGEALGVDPATGETFVLGTKPGFNSRRVRTFARIPDRTPIILGGLVSKERSVRKNRLPGLGELPGVGALFGASDWDVTQREVMIILTPYILAEDAIGVASNTPKDSRHFDEHGMELFGNRYRLRAEDVFDLSDLTRTPRFLGYLKRIEEVARRTPDHLLEPHYACFLGGDFPGGEALVARMFFDLVEKLELAKDVELDAVRIRVKAGDRLQETTLAALLHRADGAPVVLHIDAPGTMSVYAEVGDTTAPVENGGAVTLRGPEETSRFLKCVIAREMIRLNGGLEEIRIRDLRVGRFIALPDRGEDKEFDVDLETLRTYENSKNYEKVVFVSLEEALRRIDEDVEREASSLPR